MQQRSRYFFTKFFWSSTILGMAIGLMQLPAISQQQLDPDHLDPDHSLANNPPLDNIYHENDNLADDVDIFPRMGKIAGNEQEQTNCRVSPWGRVITRFSGNSFMQIDRRQVDGNGESWFYSSNSNCWIHDSRIDLL